jgi:hypothetical protein
MQLTAWETEVRAPARAPRQSAGPGPLVLRLRHGVLRAATRQVPPHPPLPAAQVIVRVPGGRRLQIISSLVGRHNVYNILAAVAVRGRACARTGPPRCACPRPSIPRPRPRRRLTLL